MAFTQEAPGKGGFPMHMADALISPTVGGAMWAATGVLTVYSARKLKADIDDQKVPLMGVLGAFIFAAQMINFTIPATGSSGHLGGGMILAILLGPQAAFLTMTSVLTVQALFFADGGLLALGCNVFNLGFFPCFVAYPLIYRKIAGGRATQTRILVGSLLSAIVSLQLGALGVVVETWSSEISELPFTTFLLLMQPIHLAIGIVEGLVTSAVVTFVWKARPEIIEPAFAVTAERSMAWKSLLAAALVVTVLAAGALSWFASTHPDGLEWSLLHSTGKEELAPPDSQAHAVLGRLQEKTAVLPGYDFKTTASDPPGKEETWPTVSAGTSVSGLVGVAITLAVVALIGIGLKRFSKSG